MSKVQLWAILSSKKETWFAVIGLAALLTVACDHEAGPALLYPKVDGTPHKATVSLEAVSPPPFSEGIFPCSNCHLPTDEVDQTPHEVSYHDDIKLQHDEKNRWCLDCHDATNRDKLHLADGRLVDFTESYRLCGQCHGPTLNDWKAGEHGKRTGSWSGTKQYLLCVSCHNPHTPSFKPLKPLPAPIRQETIK